MSKYIITIKKNQSELNHAGIKGMKWGRRRFQNEDGSLTEAGRKRYGVGDGGDGDKKSLSDKMSEIAKRNHEQNLNSEARTSAVRDSDHEALDEIRKNTKKLDDAMGIDTTPGAAKAYQENLRKNQSSGGGEKGIVPVKDAETKSFKPGDDGYEIQDAPKTKSGSDDTSKSSERPKDFYTDDFEDKTKSDKGSKSDRGPEIDDEILSEIARKANAHDAAKKRADAENLVGKAFEERQKRMDAEKREREAAEKKKQEEAEKKENAKEREKNKKERDKEEEEARKRGEERKKEAEKNRKEEEAEKKENAKEREKNKKERDKEEEKALKAAKDISNESGKIANELGNITGRQRIDVPRMNLSHLSNKQMQDAIQREIIEKQYDSMFNTTRHQAEARRERTKNFFQNVGSGLTIAGSALSIALVIKQLKG